MSGGVNDVWINTEELIARLPAPRTTLTNLVRSTFGAGRELPKDIPLYQATALAAVAQAHSRGAPRTKSTFDLVVSRPGCIHDHVVVLARGQGPELVSLDVFSPVPAMVLDLPELRDAVLAGTAIPN